MTLYKYFEARYAKRTLEVLRLKLSLPNECNDPFEFTPRTKVPTREDWLWSVYNDPKFCAGIRELAVAHGETPPPLGPQFQQFLRTGLLSTNIYSLAAKRLKPELQAQDLEFYHSASQQVAFLCLTDVNDSIPMWAHYGDNQKGVAIGFNANDGVFQNGILKKVTYRKTRVLFDRRKGNKEQAQRKLAFSKSEEWFYESEYRILFHQNDLIRTQLRTGRVRCFLDIWGSAIESVVLGCLASPTTERAIRAILSAKRFSHVKLLRMQRHPRNFALMVVPADVPRAKQLSQHDSSSVVFLRNSADN